MSARSRLVEGVLDVLQTALRMVPWPTEPGLRAVGNPGELSPVIVTCNYDLTVRRVARALDGVDAWLVVAPSQGINVWCAASGGHLGTHQVVTALKTSGVAERVRHRRAILPQLAATGVRAREVSRRCGWRTHFGPVYAEDLPRYLPARQAGGVPDPDPLSVGALQRSLDQQGKQVDRTHDDVEGHGTCSSYRRRPPLRPPEERDRWLL